jgi:AcrR family transcriptional regulator
MEAAIMPDTVRSDNRKLEFLQTALELFYEKGYENTTIQDIIDHLGVSKGAFYHYFKSKEDVIVAIARGYTDRAVNIMKTIISRTDLSAVDKLNEILKSVNEFKFRERKWRSKFRGAIKSEENFKLHNKMIHLMKQDAIGLFRDLIDSGVEEGVFGDPVNSLEMADFFLNTIFSLNMAVDELENRLYDNNNKLDFQEFEIKLVNKVRFYEVMLERVLQLKEGAIDMRTPYMIRVKGME